VQPSTTLPLPQHVAWRAGPRFRLTGAGSRADPGDDASQGRSGSIRSRCDRHLSTAHRPSNGGHSRAIDPPTSVKTRRAIASRAGTQRRQYGVMYAATSRSTVGLSNLSSSRIATPARSRSAS
jgi:hypothetical protein